MRCRKCGTPGYSRKTFTPKWRCRSGGCGFEWDDTPSSSEELVEELRLEADRRERALRREEEGHQRQRQLSLEEEERRLERQYPPGRYRNRHKERNKQRGAELAIFSSIAGAAIGRALTGHFVGAVIVAILFGAVAYYVGENWDKLKRGDP